MAEATPLRQQLPALASILSSGGRPDYALAFLDEVLSHLPVAISLYDASDDRFRVLYLNPAVESFAGPVRVPFAQRPVLEVYPEGLQNRVVDLFKSTLADGPQHLRDFVSHTNRHFDVDSYPIEGEDGRPYVVLVAQEITELMAANLAKAQFMNMAAHELRTPLSVIKGYLSMLRDGTFGPAPESWRPHLDTIAAKTVELDHLVDTVLTAARLEGSNLPARAAREDLRALVRDAILRARPRVQLMGASVELKAVDGPPLLVGIHEDHAHRIIDNLVNNALTYSPAPATVELEVQRRDSHAVLTVRDHGRGIPESHHERVFDQFVRVEDPEFGYPAGSGLGLYISRRLAEMYGGTLELLESAPGKGSTFELCLPLVQTGGAIPGDTEPA